MLHKIFTSKIRVNLLELFLINTKNKFYARQIEKIKKIPYTAVRRELENLTSIGLLVIENENNRKYYKVNDAFFLYPELKSIILKTSGAPGILKNCLTNSKIQAAFIYGSYASGEETERSDIDIFVIGDTSLKDLHKLIKSRQEALLRQININLYSPGEFAQKAKNKEHFIAQILEAPKIFLKGTELELKNIIKSWKNKTA